MITRASVQRLRRSAIVLGALAALVPLALYLPFADLDPARGVTASLSPFTDEGANIVNARDLILFGSWTTDAWSLHLLNGPFSLLEAAAFGVLGVGLVQARAVAILAVASATGLLAASFAASVGRLAAALAALAYAASALTLYYGRLAYVEPLAGLFLVLAIATLTRFGRRPRDQRVAIGMGALAGIALAASVATKAVVAPAVGGALLAVGILALRDPDLRRWLVGALAGIAIGGAIWIVAVWLPHSVDVSLMVDHVLPRLRVDVSPAGFVRDIGYFVGQGDDNAIVWSLPLLVGAVAGTVVLVTRGWPAASREPALVAAAAAVGVGLASLAAIGYHPNRYLVPLLPVAAMLVAPLGRRLIVAAAGSSQPARVALAVTLAIPLAGPGLIAYGRWTADATRALPAAQDAAARDIPPNAVVVGHYAPIVALTTRAVTIIPCCGADPVNGGDLYTERGARYIVRGGDPDDWNPAPHDALANAHSLFCFTWGQPAARTCVERLP